MTLHDDFRAAVLALGPEAYWDFQGLAPGALLDVTGHGHNLTGHGGFTVGNAVIAWDGYNYASFDGSSAYFTMAGTNPIPAGPFSIFAVLQPTIGAAIAFDNENQPTRTQGAGIFTSDAANLYAYGCRIGTGTGQVTIADTQPFSIYGSGWQWVGMIYDGVAATLYLNGSPIKAALVSAFSLGALMPNIGQYPVGGTFFRGGISDLYVLGGAQSLTSVRRLSALTGNPAVPTTQDLNAKLDAILAAVTYRAY